RLRHTSGWKPTPATKNEPPGWISPTGRKYKSEHQDWEPPHWPAQLNPGLRHADFIYACSSPGEDGLARILHTRS
ncbi:endonuclease, partial [Pseudarthrobacter sp. NamE5]